MTLQPGEMPIVLVGGPCEGGRAFVDVADLTSQVSANVCFSWNGTVYYYTRTHDSEAVQLDARVYLAQRYDYLGDGSVAPESVEIDPGDGDLPGRQIALD
jgi:hypothetical protein